MQTDSASMTSRNILLILLGLLGLGAIFGGGSMIVSPNGAMLHIPLSLLDHSPFRTFLVPGLILFFVLGLLPCSLVFALIVKPDFPIAERLNAYSDMHWSWTFTIYVAFALIIWIQVEMAFLRAVHWSHTLYMFWVVMIIAIALLPAIRHMYTKTTKKFI